MRYVRTHPRMKTAPSGVDFQSAILAFDMLGKSWWPKLKGSAFLGWFPNVSQPSFAGLLVDQGEVALIYAEWWKKFQSQLPVWEYRTQLVCASTACYNPAIQAMNLSEYGAQAKIPFPQRKDPMWRDPQISKFHQAVSRLRDFNSSGIRHQHLQLARPTTCQRWSLAACPQRPHPVSSCSIGAPWRWT